ncbi:MAG: hypothetical protein AB7O66_02405 [Limisphaerales bacterium]
MNAHRHPSGGEYLTGRSGRRPVGFRGCRGFTRTDSIVALAAVFLVASLAAAILAHTQRQSRIAQCMASLGTVNQAVLAFSRDHEETLPATDPDDPREVWWWYKEQVKPYAGLTGPSSPDDRVFACPDDRGYSDRRPFHQSARFDFTSYVFNGVTLPAMPNIAGWRTSEVMEPDRTLLVMEWSAHGPLSWHRSRTGRRNLPFYRDALNVLGFVDGHVQFAPVYYDGYNAAYTRDPVPGYSYRYSGK